MKTSKQNQVGNYGKLVSFANAQGPVYNPSKATIKMSALQTLLTQAEGSIKAADVSRTAYENACNAREAVLRTIPKLSGRIIAVLRANGASPDAIEDVMTIKRRFSSRAKKVAEQVPLATSSSDGNSNGTTMQRGHSYRDHESMIRNFQSLVIRATSLPAYQANEADLKTDALNKVVTDLKDTHLKVQNAFRAMREADQAANKFLYSAAGIYGVANAAKAYIEALYGFGSIQHKQVTQYQFKKQ